MPLPNRGRAKIRARSLPRSLNYFFPPATLMEASYPSALRSLKELTNSCTKVSDTPHAVPRRKITYASGPKSNPYLKIWKDDGILPLHPAAISPVSQELSRWSSFSGPPTDFGGGSHGSKPLQMQDYSWKKQALSLASETHQRSPRN